MASRNPSSPVADAPESALQAAAAGGLVYVSDDGTRTAPTPLGQRASSTSTRAAGACATPSTLERIRALAIPPAYRDVWICTRANGHLQATGRDARGRKQYRYHPRLARGARRRQVRPHASRSVRHCRACAGALRADLARSGLPAREGARRSWWRVLADTLVRIGNDEYARGNRSYRPDHAAQPPRRVRARRPCAAPLPRQGRARARRRARRRAPGAADAPLPAVAGADAVPVPRRRRRDAAGRLGPGQRLPARGHGRRLHRQGLPHLGRHAAGRAPARRPRGPAQATTANPMPRPPSRPETP